MLLSELFDAPELRLRLLHAAEGVDVRPIGRLITTDLLEPGSYLSGGELVLTGLVWRRSAADSETFVQSVAERGATTIIAGTAQFGAIPTRDLPCGPYVPGPAHCFDITRYLAGRRRRVFRQSSRYRVAAVAVTRRHRCCRPLV